MTTFIGDHVPNPSAFDTYNRFRSYLKVEDAFCAFFGREFLARRGWRAVVVSEELTSQEAHDIAVACKQVGYKTATALDIDHFDSGLFYKIQLDAKTLSKLEETFLTPSYLVVEEQERFMLVSDGDYYWSIASSPLFLQRCFDRPLDVVDQEFIDETRTYRDGRSRIGRSLSRIACETLGLPLSAA